MITYCRVTSIHDELRENVWSFSGRCAETVHMRVFLLTSLTSFIVGTEGLRKPLQHEVYKSLCGPA
jgi:hypothetical protein